MMLLLIALAVLTLNTRSGEGGELSKKGGVSVALEVTELSDSIAEVLSKSPTNFKILFAERDELVALVESNTATFYIQVDTNAEQTKLTLGYDSQRNYPHKQWIEQTEKSLHQIVSSVQASKLLAAGASNEIIKAAEVELQLSLNSFGEGGGNFLLIALGYLLWSVVFINALDASRSQFYSGFIYDQTNDLLPIWLTARASHHSILQSRLSVGLSIYIFGMTIFLAYCILFGALYGLFAEYLTTALPAELLSDPKLHPMTTGYLNVANNIGFIQILGIWSTFLVLGLFALSGLLHSAVNATSTEQGRTKGKVLEIIYNLIPAIGILVGYSANSDLIYMPLVGLYQLMMELIAGDMTLLGFTVCLSLQLLYIGVIIAVYGKKMNGKNRFINLSRNSA